MSRYPAEIPSTVWCDTEVLDIKARSHYVDLSFHNYPHGVDTAEKAVNLAHQAIPQGAKIDIAVLPSAGRWHDAGFFMRPLVDHDFEVKEDFSAALYTIDMKPLGMPAHKIRLGADAIRSTNYNVPCTTDTARCLRQADLIAGGLLDNPICFLNGTFRLYKESKRLQEEPAIDLRHPRRWLSDFVRFGGISHEILSTYIAEDVALGDFQRDEKGRSLFNLRAAQNVNLLLPANLRSTLQRHLSDIIQYQPIGI